MAEATKTKAQIATEVYEALAAADKLTRKAFIEEMTTKHSMTPAGASTYYVNCKNKAEGKEVKSYYKSKSQRAAEAGEAPVDKKKDDALVNADTFSIAVIANGVVDAVHSFMTEASAVERFNKLKPQNKEKCVLVHGAPTEGTPVADLRPIELSNQ